MMLDAALMICDVMARALHILDPPASNPVEGEVVPLSSGMKGIPQPSPSCGHWQPEQVAAALDSTKQSGETRQDDSKVGTPQSARTSLEPHNDPGLRAALDLVTSTFRCESVFLYGSRARATSGPGSDYDLLVIMKLPQMLASLRKFGEVDRLRTKRNIDIAIVSSVALRHRTFNTWFLDCWKDAILLSGKPGLRVQPSINRQSFFIDACDRAVLFLRMVELKPNGFQVKKGWAKRLVSYISFDASLKGVPANWARVGNEMGKEVEKTSPDVRMLGKLLNEYISKSRPSLRFSRLDQIRYVTMTFLEERRLLLHIPLQKRPVQDRFLESLVLLLGSISTDPPDRRQVGKAFANLKDHMDGELNSDSYLAWVQVRDVLVRYWNLAFRMPFGFIAYRRRIVIL
jgi:predicted nucleotidyltransferase